MASSHFSDHQQHRQGIYQVNTPSVTIKSVGELHKNGQGKHEKAGGGRPPELIIIHAIVAGLLEDKQMHRTTAAGRLK